MRFLLLSALALAACSSEPSSGVCMYACVAGSSCINGQCVPVDSGADVPPIDTGSDRPAVVDLGAVDAGLDAPDVPDVWAFSEDPAPDRPALPDVQPVDVVDAAVDVGVDAGDVGGAGDVADVPRVDVPRDAGPVDGGPVVYDLEAGRTGESYRVVYRQSGAAGDVTDCDTPVLSPSCSVTGGTLRFSLTSCFGGTTFTGNFPLSTTSGRSLSMFSGGGGSFAPTLRFTAGRRIAGSPARQSFHVQAAAPVQNREPAVAGIPGRTVDPALGDLWLLGCPSD